MRSNKEGKITAYFRWSYNADVNFVQEELKNLFVISLRVYPINEQHFESFSLK